MRKRLRIIFAFLLIAVLGGVAWQVLRTSKPEPVYQGKPLNYWIKELDHNVSQSDGFSYWVGEKPVLEIGPPAIPFLIATLKKKDSRLNDAYVSLYPKLPKWMRDHLSTPQKSAEMRANAAHGLKLFGPKAAVAVPDLMAALHDNDKWVRSAAANALGAIGPEAKMAVPALIRGLNDSDKNMALACLIGLNGAGQDSPEAEPALQHLLKDSDRNNRAWATMALGRMTVEHEAVLGALEGALQDEVPTVRDRAAQALGRLGPDAVPAVPMLVQQLELEERSAPNNIVIWKILEALEKIGPEARAATPALTNRLNSKLLAGFSVFGQSIVGHSASQPAYHTLFDGKSEDWKRGRPVLGVSGFGENRTRGE